MEKIITKKEIENILSNLPSWQIIAPQMSDSLILFKPIENVSSIVWEYTNSLKPVKEFFFPQREILFTFQDKEIKEEESIKNSIIFGIRPCDAKSLTILDKVFGGEYEDKYYFTKRKNTILIGLSCNFPAPTCFCTSFEKNATHSKSNVDILLTKLDDGSYFVEEGELSTRFTNDKKKEVINKIFQYGEEPDEKRKKEKETLVNEAEKKILKILKVPYNLEAVFSHKYWEKVANKCIFCGICRYLCATCHCFSFIDEERNRIRYWDACSFPIFTKEAAGTNPREKEVDRFKQWYYHKFSYHKRMYGEYLCVGCGRCIINCPVKIDLTQVLDKLNNL
jgi:ferredoxin